MNHGARSAGYNGLYLSRDGIQPVVKSRGSCVMQDVIYLMDNYFLLSGKSDNGPIASAFAPKRTKLAQDLISELEGINSLPFELTLTKLLVGKDRLIESDDLTDLKGIWRDYQLNSLAWPLFSVKLRAVIESNLTGKEAIDWISAKVNGNGEQKTYFIPRFTQILDVLDMQRTTFVQGTNHVIRPVFSLLKVSEYNVFHMPDSNDYWKITSGLYVSEQLKKAMQAAKLTGLDFEKTSVA